MLILHQSLIFRQPNSVHTNTSLLASSVGALDQPKVADATLLLGPLLKFGSGVRASSTQGECHCVVFHGVRDIQS